MNRKGVLVLAAAGLLAGCGGLKDAMTAHVDTVAKAGTTELTVERLAQILGRNPQIPITGPQGREVAKNLAGLWVDYHLMAEAAAKGDSLTDQKATDAALWAVIAQERIRKLGEQVIGNPPPDTANAAARYEKGEVLAAKHILVGFGRQPQPGQQMPQPVKDSALRRAQALLPQVTTANFAQLAEKNSTDPGSAQQGGSLGVFPKGMMVTPFEQALLTLKPGQLGNGVVETPFGYHIVYRPTFAEVAPQVNQALAQRTRQRAESTYIATLESKGNLDVKGDAPLWTKSIAADPDGKKGDKKVLATSNAGELTAARVAQWITALPGGPQLRAQIQQAPDSMVKVFVRQLARNELLLKQADSAKVQLDSAEMANLKVAYGQAVTRIWSGLGVEPATLADSGKEGSGKEKVASTRIETYMDRLTQSQVPFVEIPAPISAALRAKYAYSLNEQGIDRALERAATVRASADSAKAAGQPATAVPLPGGSGMPGAPNGMAPAAPDQPLPGAPAGGAAPGAQPARP